MTLSMQELIQELYRLDLAPVSEQTDTANSIINSCLQNITQPHTYSYPSGMEHNGWIIPQSWSPGPNPLDLKSFIDFGEGVPVPVGYSLPFTGMIDGLELKEHAYSHTTLPKDVPYHCDWYYKPHLRSWGIALPKTTRDYISPRNMYSVNLAPIIKAGSMQVCTWTIPGSNPDGEHYVFQAHNCHPHQANDDLSGIAVGVEVIRSLASLPHLRNTYTLLVCPEHFGTVFYLHTVPAAHDATAVLFLECLGAGRDHPILQSSYTGAGVFDQMADALHIQRYPFRTVVGNDETVWEAPPYNISCATLTRFPYWQYHSLTNDNPIGISTPYLSEAIHVVLAMIKMLEGRKTLKTTHEGLMCLSNPKYDLYQSPGNDPSIQSNNTDIQSTYIRRGFNHLMTVLPRAIHDGWGVEYLAAVTKLPSAVVDQYINQWIKLGLVA